MGLSQSTRTIFYRRQKIRPTFGLFIAHSPIFYLSFYPVTMANEVPLLDYITPIYCWTEVSTHGLKFSCRQIVGRKGLIFYRTKSKRTRTDSHSDFMSTKKKSVHVSWALVTVILTIHSAAVIECHAAGTCHDTPPHYSINTWDMTYHPIYTILTQGCSDC